MKRIIFSGILLIILGCLSYFAASKHIMMPEGFSLGTFFRVAGQPVKTVDRSMTKVIGVNAKDERELGMELAKHLDKLEVREMQAEKNYANSIIQELAKQYNPKNLQYRVFIIYGPPNAFAVAGGNIGITTGLLALLKTEAELVAILGHEKGHVDLGHCIDHMRIQAKTHGSKGTPFLDWYLSLLLNHSFSKFQENEADRFGFETLIALQYDPNALSKAFGAMLENYNPPKQNSLNPVADYFTTHPSLRIRQENWNGKANRWKQQHPEQRYYNGKINYLQKSPRSTLDLPYEWQRSS